MKVNKKFLAFNVLACMLVASQVEARITGVRTPSNNSGGGSSSRPSGPVKNTPGTLQESQTYTSNEDSSCVMDQESEKYFPLDMFQHLTRDGSSLQFEVLADNKVQVKVPAIINTCGRFVPELKQDKDSLNVAILMKINGANGKALTYKEFEDCLKEKKVLSEDGQINHDTLPGKNYTESTYTMGFDFDKNKDVKKTLKVSFAYPKSYEDPERGYGPHFGFDDKANVPGEACMRAEKVAENITYINKGQDVLLQEINDVCNSGDAQKIAEAIRSIGNADALSDIAEKIRAEMDAGYLAAVKADVKRISDEMTKIEDRLNRNREDMDEKTAQREVAKYATLAKELNSKYLDPAIYRLEQLMIERESLDDESPRLAKVDEEIKSLNDGISEFSKRNPNSFASLYSTMEKHALNDSAKTIEDIRLKSHLYGKVYAGRTDEKRGKPLNFEAANKQQVQRLQNFERTLNDWTDQHLVSKGNLFPITKTERERETAINRMNSRWYSYEQQEYKNYNSYCAVGMLGSVKNPVKCKEFVSGMDKRRNQELKKREKDLLYIKGRNTKLERMGLNYNEYQRNLASREMAEEAFDPYGSSYTSYEDNFADRFPQYYGPSMSTTYDPSLYNMGGMSNSMMMGMGQQQLMMNQGMMGNQGMMMNQGMMGNQGMMMNQGSMGGGGWASF